MLTVKASLAAVLLVCTTGLAFARPGRVRAKTLYSLYFLGDSQTDNGNVLAKSSPQVPDPTIYYQGRFTNGPNWADYLVQHVDGKFRVKTKNYAYAGATACAAPDVAALFPYVQDLAKQTAALIADAKSGEINLKAKLTKIIPIQFLGGNDVQNAFARALAAGRLPTAAELQALVASVVTCKMDSVKALAAAGFKDLFVAPTGPLWDTPAVPAQLKPALKQVVLAIDAATEAALAQLQAVIKVAKRTDPMTGVRVYALGNSSWAEAGMAAMAPPYKNTTAPCFVNPVSVLRITPGLNATLCPTPADNLWFDAIHLETRFHRWFGIEGILPRLAALQYLPSGGY